VDGKDAVNPALSPHPTDRLIRALIQTGRRATLEEIERIVDRLATAPFDPRDRRVRVAERGLQYHGRTVRAREDSLFYHLVKRVVADGQWAADTTVEQYLTDLRHAARSPDARLLLYTDRGGRIAATITPTAAVLPAGRQGPRPLPNLLVVYSADRGIIVTGYQFPTLEEIRIPQEAQWLK
jgi:hypothetical protein